MICTFDDYQLLWLWHLRNQGFQCRAWTERIASSADKQFGLGAIPQKVEPVNARLLGVSGYGSYGRSDANDRSNPRVRASRVQSDGSAKGESGKYQRQTILDVEPIERDADVLDFSDPMLMFALAQSRSAEVEAQHGKAKAVQRLHGVKHDFVVQRSSKQGMRMADQRCMTCLLCSGVEERFQASRRTVEK